MSADASEILLSTPFGGSSTDQGLAIADGGNGRLWVAGTTASLDFPVTSEATAIDPTRGATGLDHFVALIDTATPGIAIATYLGNGFEMSDAAADGLGGVCVTGTVRESDFPLLNEIQDFADDAFANEQAFAARILANGTLAYSTLFRGKLDASGSVFPSSDRGIAVASDGAGACFYVGTSDGFLTVADPLLAFPVTDGGFVGGLADAFAIKLGPTGQLVYAHVFGGPDGGLEAPFGVAVDASGAAFVAGATDSSAFPTTPGALETALPASGGGVYLVKIVPDGSSIAFATFLGPADPNQVDGGIGIGPSGDPVVGVAGVTSQWVTTPGAFAETAFSGSVGSSGVVKVDTGGTQRLWSTFVQGFLRSFSLDDEGRSFMVSSAVPADPFGIAFPTQGLLELSADGSEQPFTSAVLGEGFDVAAAPTGRVAYVSGYAPREEIQPFVYVDAFDLSIDFGGDAYLMVIAAPEPDRLAGIVAIGLALAFCAARRRRSPFR